MKKWLAILGVFLLVGMVFPVQTVQASGKSEVDLEEMLKGVKEQLAESLEEIDAEKAEEIFDFVKEKFADGSLKTDKGLENAIREGEEKFGMTVDKATAENVVEVMEKLEKLGFSGEDLVQKAKDLYGKYGADFADHANEAVSEAVKEAATEAVGGFFKNMWADTKSFFKNVFGK